MGILLNPSNTDFTKAVNSMIYVDKSELMCYTNSVVNTEQRFICVSRPRRFGKSMVQYLDETKKKWKLTKKLISNRFFFLTN